MWINPSENDIGKIFKLVKIMKKKILFAIGAILLFCSLIVAQNEGIPVELKPYNESQT